MTQAAQRRETSGCYGSRRAISSRRACSAGLSAAAPDAADGAARRRDSKRIRTPNASRITGAPHRIAVCHDPRLEQHELAIARDQVIDHLTVAVAGLEPLAHQQAQIARQRRIGIRRSTGSGRPCSAAPSESARARASSAGSVSISSGCTAQARRRGERQRQQRARSQRARRMRATPPAAAPACASGRGCGAPTRSRRSDSDSAPPNTITSAPSQISSTSGL